VLNSFSFHQFLLESCVYTQGDPVLAGVSGGMDSMVLCDLLAELKIPFAIAHVNFGLRGKESDEDEKFVAEAAKNYNVPFYLKRCTNETFIASGENSKQVAARKIRYEFFETVCQQNFFLHIAIAHHKDDSIETALLNFARGTGVKGLSGIVPVNGKIIRPLLFCTREEILVYAKEKKLSWREDSSNESDKYSRNRFRHHLLPYLLSEIPQAYAGFDASFKRLEESEELIRGAMELWKKNCCNIAENETKISIEALLQFPKSVFFLLFFLRKNGFREIKQKAVSDFLNGETGMQMISGSHRLIRDRDFLFLIDRKNNNTINPEESFRFVEETFDGKFPEDKWIALIDSSSVQLPFTVRPWQAGDKMVPFGMNGHRNVSDILNDLKLPLHKKEKAAVVVSGNEIVWVPGYRIAEKFRVTKNTSSALRLFFNPAVYGK
jgi:tRNA(Ile)-lysidine synthase